MRRMISILMAIVMVLSAIAIPVFAAGSDTYIFVSPEAFRENLGTWTIQEKESGSYGAVIRADGSQKPPGKSAVTAILIANAGDYYVWVRTRDFVTGDNRVSTRLCQIGVGGKKLDKILGGHGKDGWEWELAGLVSLKEGDTLVELIDTKNYLARVEAIVLTTDKVYIPPATQQEIENGFQKYAAKISKVVPVESKDLAKPTASSDPSPMKNKKWNVKADKDYVVLTPDSFKDNLGDWTIQENTNTSSSLLGKIMFGSTSGGGDGKKPALAKFGVLKDDIYNVFVHSRDFSDKQGTRVFQLKIGDKVYDKKFGTHAINGWAWESLGPQPMFKGEYDISAVDTVANYARFDMIVITNDLEFITGETAEELKELETRFLYKPGSVSSTSGSVDVNRPKDEIAVKLNGEYLTFDVPPVLMSGRTMVPFRAIFEALGCSVEWDEESQTAIGKRNGKVIQLPIESSIAKVDGKNMELDQSATLVNGRTLVPLRFVGESLGAAINWDANNKIVGILAQIPDAAFFLRPESFQELGTWNFEAGLTGSGAFGNTALRGMYPSAVGATLNDANIEGAKPAIATIDVFQPGKHKVWVRSRDFATNQPGTRSFHIGINGKRADEKFGAHGNTGFYWAEAGIFDLTQGKNTVELYDTSGFYARCDAILLTANLDYVPDESFDGILKIASPILPLTNIDFPLYAKSKQEPVDSVSIENSNTKVIFYKVPSSKGIIIQNEIFFNDNGTWIKTKDRSEDLGYLVVKAASAKRGSSMFEGMASFQTTFENEHLSASYVGMDPYKAGIPVWFIPTGYEKTADNKVCLTFDNHEGKLDAVWELEENNKSPKVSLTAVFDKDGVYSFGVFEGAEFADDKYEFAMIPYRMMGKRVPTDVGLMSEMYSFTPMATITLPMDNTYANGKHITKGVAVEPSWIPLRWTYNDNGLFGLGLRGSSGYTRGTIFAPIFGAEEGIRKAGQPLKFTFRIISCVDDWFSAYKHATQDIFGVHDYRQNYYTSLNDAIFNTTDLMLDDLYSGWDSYDKSFYNMEMKNTTSQANPMLPLQSYLLTENKEILTRRAIPTLANLLTREGLHFNRTGVTFDDATLSDKTIPYYKIGKPIAGYNTNVMGGVFEMTRGMVPELLNYGVKTGQEKVVNAYGSIPGFANYLSLYKYSGDQKYLNSAIEGADQYLKDVVYGPKTSMPSWNSFIYISYYPNLASLIDIYEVTKDNKYLDAAVEVGKWITACTWISGIDGEKLNQPIIVNESEVVRYKFHYGRENNEKFWFHGDQQFRIGAPKGNPGSLESLKIIEEQKETVPAWVPSRVGLGLEQSSTFPNSSNIIMSSWVGDLLKLAGYSGEEYFETVARNAIIGRFGNYSGYYQNSFMTYHQKADYPYNGPDYTGIYWHHIPPFLAMLQDFIINNAWLWSEKNIEFPSLRQQGYAYFNSNQYGHAPGKFFDVDDMWLWLDRGIAEPDSLQIDWIAARKDGVLGVAFMNESDKDVTTAISLGDKIPGGNTYTGKATLYNPDKSKTQIDVINGKFTLTVPAKSLKAVVLDIPSLKKPAFANVDYTLNKTEVGQTVADHGNGKAYVLQMTPENYYAYVYITDTPETVKSLTMKYKIGDGKEETVSTDVYPYEFIIEVPDPTKAFTYSLETTGIDGKASTTGGRTIKPIR